MKNKECEHKLHFVKLSPLPMWLNATDNLLTPEWKAVFVCEKCGMLKKIKTKEE